MIPTDVNEYLNYVKEQRKQIKKQEKKSNILIHNDNKPDNESILKNVYQFPDYIINDNINITKRSSELENSIIANMIYIRQNYYKYHYQHYNPNNIKSIKYDYNKMYYTTKPILSILIQFDNKWTIDRLNDIYKILENNTLDHIEINIYYWIYALLIKLEKPITANISSLLISYTRLLKLYKHQTKKVNILLILLKSFFLS